MVGAIVQVPAFPAPRNPYWQHSKSKPRVSLGLHRWIRNRLVRSALADLLRRFSSRSPSLPLHRVEERVRHCAALWAPAETAVAGAAEIITLDHRTEPEASVPFPLGMLGPSTERSTKYMRGCTRKIDRYPLWRLASRICQSVSAVAAH